MKKKNRYNVPIILVLLMMLVSSCLKKDLPDYPAFDGKSITVVNAEHRFKSRIHTMHGEPLVVMKGLSVSSVINDATSEINLTVTIPAAETGETADFNAEEKAMVKQSMMWFFYTISTGATMKAIEGTAEPGYPSDATKPLRYRVTAADGSTRDWTVKVTSFINN